MSIHHTFRIHIAVWMGLSIAPASAALAAAIEEPKPAETATAEVGEAELRQLLDTAVQLAQVPTTTQRVYRPVAPTNPTPTYTYPARRQRGSFFRSAARYYWNGTRPTYTYTQPRQQPTYTYTQPRQQPTYTYTQPTQQPTYTYTQPNNTNSVQRNTNTTQAAPAQNQTQTQTQTTYQGGDPYGFTAWLNGVRAQYGLPAVSYDPNLSSWANANNAQQQSRGLGHHVMGPARRQNSAIGNAGTIGSMWMNSPAHRAALLDPTIRTIGIAGMGAYWTFNAR